MLWATTFFYVPARLGYADCGRRTSYLHSCVHVATWRSAGLALFFGYLCYGLVRTTACAITLSRPHVYFYVYWATEPLAVILSILAVYECFRRVFRIFFLLRWFRFVFPASIAIALLGSALVSYISPPRHASVAGAMIISAMTAAQYVILAVSTVFFALVLLLAVRCGTHVYRVVMGFGFSSLATAAAAVVRSVFVAQFAFFSSMFPGIVYVFVLAIWLTAMLHPLPPEPVFVGEGFSPEEVVRVLRRDLSIIRLLLRRPAGC